MRAIKGQLLSIRIRIATVAHAATTKAAQIELAASQKRPEVTKLAEKERDEALRIRFCTASGEKLLMYRLTLMVAFMPRTNAPFAPGTREVKYRAMRAEALS